MVRVASAFSTHAYAVKAPFFSMIAAAMREGLEQGRPCDVVLAEIQEFVPSYAFYPNLAWQVLGHSDLKGTETENYGPGGVQRWHRATLYQVDALMRTAVAPGKGTARRLSEGPVEFRNFWRNFNSRLPSGDLTPRMGLLFAELQGLRS